MTSLLNGRHLTDQMVNDICTMVRQKLESLKGEDQLFEVHANAGVREIEDRETQMYRYEHDGSYEFTLRIRPKGTRT